MTTVLLATFSSAVAKTSRDRIGSFYNKALIYSLLATLPPIIYIGIFSKPLVFIFITKQYSLTPLYVSLMALGTAIGLPWLYSSSFMVANGYVKKVLKYAAVSVAVQLAVMLLLIRQFTTIGVIVSIFFVGNIVSDILLAGGIRNVLGIKHESGKLLKVAFAGVIAVVFTMLGLLLHSFWLQLIIGAIIFLLIYPFALLFVRILDSVMLNDVIRIVKGLPLLDKFINLEVAYIYALSKLFRIKIS
jgi:O-antigen/teichoic acid export membrane protein